MALTFPLALADFLDVVYPRLTAIEWDVQRYDELSGLGSKHIIASEMADPAWKAKLIFATLDKEMAAFLAARVRALQGPMNALMVYDPSHRFPMSDPLGVTLGASSVQINSIGGNRKSISFKGLPGGYVLKPGDRGQIDWGTGRVYYFELSEGGTGATTAALDVFPHVPVGIAANAVVKLARPACRMALNGNGFAPGRGSSMFVEGVTLDLLEKL